ncbi:hypothetical protein SYK_02950 [Pseudodesulfovibrio nedwellii]|uniref:Peptidase S74 domain-containing protein n=1 Tax=Pseudodesulfovibrio nedwellii TaxID=2973072 RepID=A0ABM8AWN0_9BACT|nr:tail fiber domain-containing protein [Pseudodesulfovibrio nedwellii]BDQ35935.1 hypothetical protein SYK_02950 [Pseudodesulfovibrio nedwellii]
MSLGGDSGGSSTSYQIDPESSRRLAAVSERQQDQSEKMFNLYEESFLPYEKDMIAYNQALLPFSQELSQKQLESESNLLPLREEATAMGLQEMMDDIELNKPLKERQVQEQLRDLDASAPVRDQFFAEAAKGPDYEGAMGRATANVASAYKDADAITRRSISRMGANPNSGRTEGRLTAMGLGRAKDTAFGKEQAHINEDDKSFNKMTTAMQMRAPTTGVNTGVAASGVTGQTGAQRQVGNYSLQNPANLGSQLLAGAGSTAAAGRITGQTTTTKGNGFSDFLGKAGGTAAGVGMTAMMMSSKRWKQDIRPIEYGPDAIDSLKPVHFAYKKAPGEDRIGFIAEDLDKTVPEVVAYGEDGLPLGIRIGELMPLLVSSIQDLRKRVETMEVQ